MKRIIIILSLLVLCFISVVGLSSCGTNYDISSNSFQTFSYVYIISEDRYIEISTWVIGDYGILKFTDKNGHHYCVCQANWIIYENSEDII